MFAEAIVVFPESSKQFPVAELLAGPPALQEETLWKVLWKCYTPCGPQHHVDKLRASIYGEHHDITQANICEEDAQQPEFPVTAPREETW